ncbi:magnesium transporter CorA family protein [Lactobacillus selangorensis]|nr:magnesium transporter CorA family protein [Lactobacillus selangorensis]
MITVHTMPAIATDTSWIEITAPTADEVAKLKADYGLTDEILKYALDPNERTNYDYDLFEQSELFVYHVPYRIDADDVHYITAPISLIYQGNYLFTFNVRNIERVNRDFAALENNAEITDYANCILMALLKMSDEFIPALEEITATRNDLDQLLDKQTTNENLHRLSHLAQSLAYFTSATNNNEILLRAMPKAHFGEQLDAVDQERLDDVLVEAKQVAQMTATETEVTDRISNTFNNVLNNNLNGIMKFMTIWSLVLAIPTIVTGFYGMNVKLPFSNVSSAWLLVIGISLFFVVWMILMFKRRHML